MQVSHPQADAAQVAVGFALLKHRGSVVGQQNLALRRGLAHIFGRIGTGVIAIPARIRRGSEGKPLFAHVGNDVLQAGFLLPGREFGVGVTHGHNVVRPNLLLIRVCQVDFAVHDLDSRRRVFHYGRAAIHAGREVVVETESVAGLMRCKEGLSEQHKLLFGFGRGVRREADIKKFITGRRLISLPKTANRAYAIGFQANASGKNFASARIRETAAGGIAALIAIHPVNLVVSDVHRVHVGRSVANLESVLESGGFEGFIPPEKPVLHGGACRLRDSGIQIVDNALFRFAKSRARVFLLQTMAPDPFHYVARCRRQGVIHEANSLNTDTQIGFAWFIPGRRFDKTVMQTSGEHSGIGRGANTACECLVGCGNLHLAVFWKALGMRKINRATRWIEAPCSTCDQLERLRAGTSAAASTRAGSSKAR